MHFYVFDLLGVQFCQNLSIELVHCAAATTIQPIGLGAQANGQADVCVQPIGKYLTRLGHSSPLPARGMGQGQGQGLMDCPLFKADYNCWVLLC